MALATRGRRSITVDGREYYWWVKNFDDDFIGTPTLTVASKQRGLYVRYGQAQDERRYAVVLGPVFRGIEGLGGAWRRFFCPRFGNEMTIGPRDVAAFIRWCTASDGKVVEFDWRGKRTTHDSQTIRWPQNARRTAQQVSRPSNPRRPRTVRTAGPGTSKIRTTS